MFALRRRLVLTGVGVFMTLLVLCVSSQSLELNNTGPSKDALCKEFLADKEVQGQMTSLRDKATPCPCQEKIISTDYTFRQTGSENLNNTGTGSCYQEWFPNEDGVKQMCCYRMDGTLRTGSNNGGYIVPNNTPYNITDVHSNCCHGDHVLCEQFYEMIPSDDCSRYTTPVSARSYGDPTITTLDGHSYSFNGHGEYVFLKTNDTEIQARTEYVTKGNKDATMFTAFVFHINKKTISIEAHLNRSTKAIQVYNNGILLCNSSKTSKGPCGKPPAPIGGCLMILAGNNKTSITDVDRCGFGTFTKSITLTAGEMMDITFDGLKTEKLDNTTQGLAGVTANDNYISRNDSKTSVNASASDIFDFGETWALRNRSESLFYYSLPDGHSYSFYNSNHTRPRFLEELVGNLTALFENFTEANITKFDATCRNYWDNETNTECLLAIASNNNYNFGLNVMKTANETRRQYEITHNTAPYFYKNMSDISVIDVIPHSNETSTTIDLSKYASDNESKSGLRFIIDSEIPTSDYSISAKGVFNWNFTDELRNITLTKLKINVYDTYNKSAQYNMFVRYCGCEHGMAECTDFPEADTNSTKDYILTAKCNCEKGYEGTYCENRTNPCLITKCYEDRCNSSASVGENPCLPCPHGYEGDGTTCSDIDECDPSYEEIDKCDQMCNNTEGSFNCSCKIGYRLNNDNHTCDDIDECKEGTKICSEIHHEVCVNNIGDAVCNCMPNYMRKTENGSCETIGDAAMFVGTISIQITITKYTDDINKTVDTEENRKQMETTLDERFKGTTGYLGVEVFKLSVVITNSPTGRKKREVKSGKLDVDCLVKWRNISYGTEKVFKDLEGSSSRYNANRTTEEKPFGLADVVTLNLKTIRLEPNNGTEKGVCQVPGKSDCDTMSTTCNNIEGGFKCDCKQGFIDVKLSTKYCADKNECVPDMDMSEKCINGSCFNQYGSFNCSCSSDRTWQSVGNLTNPRYRCQGNYSYIGHAEIMWGGLNDTNDIKAVIKNEIIGLFRNTDVNEDGTPISELMVTATVLQLNTSFVNGSTLAHVTYNIQMGTVVSVSNIKDILDPYDDYGSSNPNVTSLTLSVYDESDNMLCELSNNGGCDTSTTKCQQKDGNTVCTCKKGYQKKSESDKFCSDFDECTNSTYQCLGEGYCINNVGTWSCGCNKTDYRPYRMNDSAIRCMGDFQYTGEMNITTRKILTISSLKDLFNTTIHNALKNKTNTVNVSSSNTSVQMSDIFLFSEIVFGSINPRDIIPHVHVTTLKFIIHTGEPVLFSKMNLTYSGNTSFSNNKSIFGMDIALFSEDDFNLCNITGKTKCHLDTTYCRVKDGSYRCDCKEGFKNTTDPYICDNIDECNDSTYKCINGSTCIDSIGNWSCACPTGYIEDRINSTVIGCADINECNNTQYSCDGPTDTSATCHNTIGSWNCNCSQGFRLSNNWKYRQRCEDIDECKKNPCKDGGTCSNFPGGFNCSCLQGYDLKNSTNGTYSCEDINECNAPNACIRSLSCSNIPGDWLCTCSEGLEEMQINSSSKMCGGGYEYVAEIRFNLVNIITSIEKFNTNFENKLQSLYKEAYEGKLIQIEIISTRVLSSSNRFRTTLTPYVTKYIIQYVEKMNQTDLQKMENYYLPKETCNYNVCGFQNISDTKVQFVNFTVLNNSAICETPRNVCNKDKSTCVSNDGLLDCKCNKGFMKTSNYSLFCEDFNECNDKRYLCNGTSSVCRNSVGAWSCDCKAGYTPIIKSDYHIVCKGNTYSYPFSISLTICGPDPKNDTAIKLSIQQQLEQKYMTLLNDSDVWVEILKIVKVTSERRDINIENKVNVTYIVHTANTTTAAIFKNAAKFNLTIPCCNAPCEVSPASIDNSVLCSKCDSNSTNCSTTNNELRCDCKDGFDSKNGTSCKDIDECFSSNYICNGTCTNTVGSWNCTCKAGYKTVSKSNTAVECHDPCEKSKCHEQSLCVRFDNVDGYKCGCTDGRSGIYCETVNTTSTSTSTSDKTIFIAAGSTLGGVIAILVIVVIIVCRWRAAKIKEAEKIAMDHLENSRVIAFDNEYLADQYLPNGRNGSINSERVSNGFVRNGSLQNGTRHSYDDRNGPNYSKPVKPPKPRYHNTLADAADASRSRDSSQPFSYNVYNPPGLMRSGNQLDNRGNPNNGRSSPIPDYDAPRSPRPDYGHRDASYDSKDSGVGNGYHGNGYSIDTDFYRGKRIPSAARTERGLSTNF